MQSGEVRMGKIIRRKGGRPPKRRRGRPRDLPVMKGRRKYIKHYVFIDSEEFLIEGRKRRLSGGEKILLDYIQHAIEIDELESDEVKEERRPAWCELPKSVLAALTGITPVTCFGFIRNLVEAGLITKEIPLNIEADVDLGNLSPLMLTPKFVELSGLPISKLTKWHRKSKG